MLRIVCAILLCAATLLHARSALAWGDEGHEIVGLIAEHYLEPGVAARVRSLLAADTSGLTSDTTIASESTWADRYRDSDRNASRVHYGQTHRWHFVDLELSAPDLDAACFGHPRLRAGTPASAGPAKDCVVDKIEQFEAELGRPERGEAERGEAERGDRATGAQEHRVALQFLLHLVGDVHQPLHAIDDRDEGGNRKRVAARGMRAATLHHFWDTEFVQQLGLDPQSVANDLIARISAADLRLWRRGNAADWARESYAIGKAKGYAELPRPGSRGSYRLSESYVHGAVDVVATQLSKAGVRLAILLNSALAPSRRTP